jgi:tetratricopeptide (TPR) repeat protein
MKKGALLILFMVLLGNSSLLLAQTEPEEIKQDTNQFQEFFYASLLQKGIENHDKAIKALEECVKLQPNNATVYFELGKNYLALKDYEKAYNSFQQATTIDPTNKWFWVGMYDVSFHTKNYNQAILVLNKLIGFEQKYKEDLASLYMSTKQFDKALELINELNGTYGKTERRELYKMQILSEGKYQSAEISNLIAEIDKNPTEESNYIALINLYSKNNEDSKALDVVKKLEVAVPSSEWAQVSLFKVYLDNNEAVKAIKAMNISLASAKIDAKIKHRIINEFLIYVDKNPQYLPDLEKAISYFDTDKGVNIAKEIGRYYHSKKQLDKAISFYEKAVNNGSEEDIEANLLLLQAYTEDKRFDVLSKRAMELIESFPTEAQFYYYSGLANNQLQAYKKAKEVLEMGLDYLVENKTLEINFNIQLGEAYSGLGDFKKKELYFSKANQLLKEKK